jgi:ABC-type bacteriocin transporter
MSRVKLIKQFDSSDCGPACITMIANYHGKRISLTQAREWASTDKNSTNLKGLIESAERIGFNAQALKGDADSLTPDLDTPFIAHLNKEGLFHFIVVTKITQKTVTYADPADGNIRKPIKDFLKLWTGYVVFISPSADFKRGSESLGLFQRFLPLLQPHKKTILHTVIASLLITVMGIAGAMYFRILVDDILFSESRLTLHVVSIGVLLVTLLQVLLEAVRSRLLVGFSMKVDLSISLGYLSHLFKLPLSFFDSRKVGEILSRLSDTVRIREALSSATFSVFFDTIMVVGIGIVLAVQNLTLFFIALLFVPLSAGIVWGFAGPFKRKYQEILGGQAESQANLVETVSGIATVKAQVAEIESFHKAEGKIMKQTWPVFHASRMGIIQNSLVGLIDGWGSNLLFWIGSTLILGNQISLGQLISFNALIGYFLGPLQNLIHLQPNLQEAFVAARRVGEVLDIEPEIDESRSLVKPKDLSGDIVFQDVDFRYGSKKLVLKKISFKIDGGSTVGIAGSSGSGKSSLIKLIMKLYKAESGKISINEVDIEDIDPVHLRQNIGYVNQDIFLFSGTIRENIAFGNPGADAEDIIEAAKRSGAHGFISELPQRYDTELSEQGGGLSGGEKQRIAIARALVTKPDILIFDEATSNLDAFSEFELHQTISELKRTGMTIIMVAHRLSSINKCDQIILLADGEVQESGTHEELINAGKTYSQLWEAYLN